MIDMHNNKTFLFNSSFVIAIALLLLPQMLMAQLRVDGFELLSNDLTAMTRGMSSLKPNGLVTDQNGEVAALIKIVTPMTGFNFDGGQLGIVGTEQHEGEIWLFVPRYSLKLTITHRHFGELREYVYPVTVEGGRTYRMLLNTGGGRFVNINTTGADSANISIDGKAVGQSPIYNHFMNDGIYVVSGVRDRFEGTDTLYVSSGNGPLHYSLRLTDQIAHFGNVEINVADPHADIYYQGKRVGAGQWRTMLKEGYHEVLTRKKDCNDAVTRFQVVAQQQNDVQADLPVPYTGQVFLFTRPRNVVATYDNNQPIDLTETRVLPVGKHQFQFTRKGWVTQDLELEVLKDQLTTDTIQLEAINYLKSKWAFYFGAGYTLQGLSGLTGYVGAVYQHVDLQLSYTLGMSSSKDVYNYNKEYELLSGNTYKMNAFAARLGYQLRLIPRLGITPQVGFMQQMLTSTVSRGTGKYADGAKASSLTLGAKILAVPAHRVYLFLTPEYALEMSKDATFDKAAQAADFQPGGFSISAGVLINIGK